MLRAAGRRAEDAGDFEGALRLVRQLPADCVVTGATGWIQQLERAQQPMSSVDLARWLVHPALRWAAELAEGRALLDSRARVMLAALGVPAAQREIRLPAMSSDPVVMDSVLFDGGFFARYVAEVVSPGLAARAGPVGQWAAQPMSIWQVLDERAGVSRLRDQFAGADGAVPACEVARPPGTLLYGRLMPVDGPADGAATFALGPEVVDRRCAARVLRARQRGPDPTDRIRAVALSRLRAQPGSGSG